MWACSQKREQETDRWTERQRQREQVSSSNQLWFHFHSTEDMTCLSTHLGAPVAQWYDKTGDRACSPCQTPEWVPTGPRGRRVKIGKVSSHGEGYQGDRMKENNVQSLLRRHSLSMMAW